MQSCTTVNMIQTAQIRKKLNGDNQFELFDLRKQGSNLSTQLELFQFSVVIGKIGVRQIESGVPINFIGFYLFQHNLNIMSRVLQTNAPYTTTGYTSQVPVAYTTTTSNYAPVVGATASNVYTADPRYYTTQQVYTGPVTTGATYTTGGAYTTGYTTGAQYVGGQYGQAYQVQQGGYQVQGQALKAVAEEIPVESRIEYIPFEKKYVEYEQVEKIYQVPVETEVIEYEEVVRNERVPVERIITDYYAVETQVEYIRREIEETVMVEEPIEKIYERVQYIPVETQIVHYPQRDNYVPAKTQVRTEYVGVQGQAGTTTTVQGGQTSYVQSGSRVGGTYVTGGSGVGATTTYQTGYTQYAQPTTQIVSQPIQYSTQGYTSTTAYPGTYETYQTGSYVPSGSGVRATGGYVTGGSGVRGNTNATYVSTGTSKVNQTSYETKAGYY